MDFNNWNPFWTACFGALACMIIIGNTLSIIILLNRRLRKRPHYLLISLAFADLMVGSCAMPIYMTFVISGQQLVSVLVSDAADIFTGISSIFTLAVISLERLNAVARPLRHRQLTLSSYLVAIVTPWILSLLVTSSRVLALFHLISKQLWLSVLIISLSTPFLISCVAYTAIWRKRRARGTSSFRQNQESRFSTTVFLITGAFFLTWMPFQVLIVIAHKCVSCMNIPPAIVFLIKFLQFSNSAVNFFIYFFRLPSYRKAMLALFSRCW